MCWFRKARVQIPNSTHTSTQSIDVRLRRNSIRQCIISNNIIFKRVVRVNLIWEMLMKFKCSKWIPLYFGLLFHFNNRHQHFFLHSFEIFLQFFLASVSFIRKRFGIFLLFDLIYSNSEFYCHSGWTVIFIHLRLFYCIHCGHTAFANFVFHFKAPKHNLKMTSKMCNPLQNDSLELLFWFFCVEFCAPYIKCWKMGNEFAPFTL